MIGLYEYCGIQRCGKSTLMMSDWLSKILTAGYRPQDTWANFAIFVDGVHCLTNENMIDQILRMKRDHVRNQVLLFDEVGQELKARGFGDKIQTEIVNFAWQMPKRGIILSYCSNVGNSADIILRLATWLTIMPRYFYPDRGNRFTDYILFDVIYDYDVQIDEGYKVTGFQKAQELFDSWQPID
jgi:hypothetical protein